MGGTTWEVTWGGVSSNGVLYGWEWFISLFLSISCEKLGVSGSSACEVGVLNKNSFWPILVCAMEVEVVDRLMRSIARLFFKLLQNSWKGNYRLYYTT